MVGFNTLNILQKPYREVKILNGDLGDLLCNHEAIPRQNKKKVKTWSGYV